MQKIKELYQQLEQSTNDTERIELLANLSAAFLNTDVKRCAEVVEQLGELAKKLNNPKAFAYYYSGLGRISFAQSKFRGAEKAFNKAIIYAQEAESATLVSNCYHSLGMVYWKEGNFEQSLAVSLKSLEFFKNQDDHTGNEAMCYNNIGNIYERMGKYDQAEEAYLKGRDILKGNDDVRMLYNVQGNLGIIKLRKKEYKKALVFLNHVLEGFKTIGHNSGEILTLVQIGHAHMGLNEYATAMTYYTRALKELKKSDHKLAEAEAYRGLGNVFVALGGYDDALKHFNKGLELLQAVDYPSGICEFYEDYANLYAVMNDVSKAIEMLDAGLTISKKRKLDMETQKLKAKKALLLNTKSKVAS